MSKFDFGEEAIILEEKVNYFNSQLGINNFDIAMNYLILADWDEKKAVRIYRNLSKNQNILQNSSSNSNQRNALKQNNNNNLISQQPQQPEQIRNDTEFHVTDIFLKDNVIYKNNDLVQFSNFVKYVNSKFTLVAKSLESFMKFLKEHAGIIILVTLDKFEEVKRHLRKIFYDDLSSEIVKNSVLFPIMQDSILGNELSIQFSCISFPSYLFCKYKNQKDLKIDGRMEGEFNISLFIDNLLNAIPDSKSALKSSLRQSLNESKVNNNNIQNNNNEIRNNNNNDIRNNSNNNRNNVARNNNNNADFFVNNGQDFFLGNSVELNQLIEQLAKDDFNNNNQQFNNNQNNNINKNNNLNNNYNNRYNNNQYNNSFYNSNPYINNPFNNNPYNNNQNNNRRYNNNPYNNNPFNNNSDNNNLNHNIPSNNNLNNSINNNSIDIHDSIAGLSYGEIMQKREREMKELERKVEEKLKKEEEEKRKKLEEENKKKKLEEEYQKEVEYSKNNLPPEPDENNPNICKIVLRYPDGERTMERRFLKTDNINVLYLFVKSKGREIFFEKDSNDFDLCFSFPPKNLENSKKKTLEEEGMFPNAVINIREK